ncbi:X-linked retinitis pigmentosa GTPase regulator [Yersinia phage fHe-Yen9-03]|uniref:X-linked retinitis pigmentosa GTPase regulator n=1 Tax=Yersinia phage fHe-Yen9-03 TaxID=2052743 RepID=A0A2C9CZZ5_9CAUD|nr:X-linked retinitis pigmentosa GTPase regulator [Yersinia phage fHe-Yen9-03]
MLPFPIISNTNIPEPAFIKDIQTGYSNLFQTIVLLNTGLFYTSGYNTSGQLGVGNKVNRFNVLTYIRNDVRLMSCNASSTMIVTNTNKVYISGARDVFNLGGTSNEVTVFTDVSSYFSTIDISQIKKISFGFTTMVLMNNNDLYGIGLNRYGELGTGVAVGYKALTFIRSNVLDVTSTGNSTVLMLTDGTVWGAGRNATYCLQSSTEGGVLNASILSLTRMFSTVTDPILGVRVSESKVIAYTSGTGYCLGSNDSGTFGDGNTSFTNTNSTGLMIQVQLPVQYKSSPSKDMVFISSPPTSSYIGIDDKLHVCGGNNNGGALGLGVSTSVIGSYTIVPVLISSTDIIRIGTYTSYIGRMNNIILGCGSTSLGITSNTLGTSFIELTLPF